MNFKSLTLNAGIITFLSLPFILGNYNTNSIKFNNQIKKEVSNQVKGSTEYSYPLEKIIFEQIAEGRIKDEKRANHFFSNYISNLGFDKNYGRVIVEFSKSQKEVLNLEDKLCLINNFHLLPGIETDYGRDLVSNTKVRGFVQTSEIAVKDIKGFLRKDKMIVERLFSPISLDKLKFEYSSVDDFLKNTNFEMLGYDTSEEKKIIAENQGINKAYIQRFIIPRYILTRKVFPNGIDENKVFEDNSYNLKIAACYYLSNILELSSLSIVEKKKNGRFNLDYDMKGSNVFNEFHYLMSYNLGTNPIKKLARLVGPKISNNFLHLLKLNAKWIISNKPRRKAKEVFTNNQRAIDYSIFFEQLEKSGFKF